MSDDIKYTGWATKRGKLKKNWKRRYFVLRKDNILSYYVGQEFIKSALKGTVDIGTKGIEVLSGGDCEEVNWPREAPKSTRFEIRMPSRSFYVFCDTPQEQNLWVAELRRSAGLLEEVVAPKSGRPVRKPSANEELQAKLRDKLKDITQLEGNDRCFECHKEAPSWTSWNIGVFLCLGCAGSHKCLGPLVSSIKNINLDTWSRTQVEWIESMGNKRAEAYYEANLPEDFVRPDCEDIEEMESFLKEKYIEKRWASNDTASFIESDNNTPNTFFSEIREENKDASYTSAMEDNMTSHNWL
eukprot:m.60400 g.60400  ORF g.60400 m.60400 type:complete len:299 (-) comp7940_c1_seq1:828-1724(-)